MNIAPVPIRRPPNPSTPPAAHPPHLRPPPSSSRPAADRRSSPIKPARTIPALLIRLVQEVVRRARRAFRPQVSRSSGFTLVSNATCPSAYAMHPSHVLLPPRISSVTEPVPSGSRAEANAPSADVSQCPSRHTCSPRFPITAIPGELHSSSHPQPLADWHQIRIRLVGRLPRHIQRRPRNAGSHCAPPAAPAAVGA